MPRDVGPRLAVLESLDHARRFASFSSFELRMIPGAEPQLGIALHELLRLAGFAFVAAESRGPAPTERLRRDDKRAAELLRSLERVVPSGIPLTPAVADVRTPADRVAEGASLSDQAALEANALFLSELERAHAVTA